MRVRSSTDGEAALGLLLGLEGSGTFDRRLVPGLPLPAHHPGEHGDRDQPAAAAAAITRLPLHRVPGACDRRGEDRHACTHVDGSQVYPHRHGRLSSRVCVVYAPISTDRTGATPSAHHHCDQMHEHQSPDHSECSKRSSAAEDQSDRAAEHDPKL